MRSDMAKVIVERPRTVDGATRKGRRRGIDDVPTKVGMIRHQRMRGGFKTLNENLAPLRRFLHKQVGRRWDDVFSEIAANLRVDSTVQQHVRDHIKDFVEFDRMEIWHTVVLSDGSRERRLRPSWRLLYVDPEDGILKVNAAAVAARAERRRKPDPEKDTVRLSGMKDLRRIDGVWYEVDYMPFPEPEYVERDEVWRGRSKPWRLDLPVEERVVRRRRLVSPPVYDVVLRREIDVGPQIDENGSVAEWRRENRRYAVVKRQISGRMLRRYGLDNAGVSAEGRVLRTG